MSVNFGYGGYGMSTPATNSSIGVNQGGGIYQNIARGIAEKC